MRRSGRPVIVAGRFDRTQRTSDADWRAPRPERRAHRERARRGPGAAEDRSATPRRPPRRAGPRRAPPPRADPLVPARVPVALAHERRPAEVAPGPLSARARDQAHDDPRSPPRHAWGELPLRRDPRSDRRERARRGGPGRRDAGATHGGGHLRDPPGARALLRRSRPFPHDRADHLSRGAEGGDARPAGREAAATPPAEANPRAGRDRQAPARAHFRRARARARPASAPDALRPSSS